MGHFRQNYLASSKVKKCLSAPYGRLGAYPEMPINPNTNTPPARRVIPPKGTTGNLRLYGNGAPFCVLILLYSYRLNASRCVAKKSCELHTRLLLDRITSEQRTAAIL